MFSKNSTMVSSTRILITLKTQDSFGHPNGPPKCSQCSLRIQFSIPMQSGHPSLFIKPGPSSNLTMSPTLTLSLQLQANTTPFQTRSLALSWLLSTTTRILMRLGVYHDQDFLMASCHIKLVAFNCAYHLISSSPNLLHLWASLFQ